MRIGATAGALPVSAGIYPAGQLYKSVTIDEDSHLKTEYKDITGNIILRKVQLNDVPGAGVDGWLCTYYIYDDLNNLRFVLQPKAVDLIQANWTVTQGIADELCFRYEYDQRQRMIIKKLPGAGEVWMVYD